jgi:hypothetical protein
MNSTCLGSRLHTLSLFNLLPYDVQPSVLRRSTFCPSTFNLPSLTVHASNPCKILTALARLATSLVSCALDRFSTGASPAISSNASADSWLTNMGEKSCNGSEGRGDVSLGHFTSHVVYPLTNQSTTPCIYPASETHL